MSDKDFGKGMKHVTLQVTYRILVPEAIPAKNIHVDKKLDVPPVYVIDYPNGRPVCKEFPTEFLTYQWQALEGDWFGFGLTKSVLEPKND